MEKPKLLKPEEIDVKELIATCEAHINNYNPDSNDDVHYIYEAAMTTLYGKDVFKYLNSLS